MEAKSDIKVLTDFFNSGEGKRPLKVWGEEIKALSPEEKKELADGVRELLNVLES